MPRSAKKRKKLDSNGSADIDKTPVRRDSGRNSGSSTTSTNLNKTPDSSMYTSRLPSFGFGLKSPSELQFISPSQVDMHRDVMWQDTTAEECRRRLKAKNSAIYEQEEEGSRTPPIRRLSSATTPKRKPNKNHSNSQLMEKLQIMSKRIAQQKEEEARIKSQVDCEDSLFEDDWEEDPDIDFFASTVENETIHENGEAESQRQTEKEDSDSDIFNDDFIDDAVLQCTQELEEKCEKPPGSKRHETPRKPCVAQKYTNGTKRWQQRVNEKSTIVKQKEDTKYDVNRQWQPRTCQNTRSNNQQRKLTATDVEPRKWDNSRNTKHSYPVFKRETPSRNCKNMSTSYQYSSRSNASVQVKKPNTTSTVVNTVKTTNSGRSFAGSSVQTRQQTMNQQQLSSFSALGQNSRAKAVPLPSVQIPKVPESDSDKDDSLMDDEEFMSSLISTLEQVDRDLL